MHKPALLSFFNASSVTSFAYVHISH